MSSWIQDMNRRTCRGISVQQAHPAVTNIGQLLAALAIEWEEGSGDNRSLVAVSCAFHNPRGRAFVRVRENRFSHDYAKQQHGDIAIDPGGYSLAGFLMFDARGVCPGMFDMKRAHDGAWHSAMLTRRGFEIAAAGVIPFDVNEPHLNGLPFFTGTTKTIEPSRALSHGPLSIEKETP